MGDAGGGTLLDDFGLAEDLPDELADARPDRVQREVCVLPGVEDVL